MIKRTKQEGTWAGDFGQSYTDRNPQSPAEMDELYRGFYGISRTELNSEFLGDLDRGISILEVGTNVGTQLRALQQMGFTNLTGLELQEYALERARALSEGITFIQGSAFDLPFTDLEFDLVFTSGVLIHLAPADLNRALDEIHRCAGRWIWGFEYFAETHTSIPYRGRDDLLWKGDFARLYLDRFADLRTVRERRIPYLESGNIDTMFLLARV
ncbi:MAG TPA: methyltransferase domain-containing protein [bacterium]|nr:methyltransferase domain-containing protein [bacterium]HQO34403.1 methyltransferase domain-containing protein [bacterium]HQP97091.1 methyltransferase domain-containing protein [bacterium]